MNNYFFNLNETLKQYFNILSNEIPDFLYDYIDTTEMQRQKDISVSCGAIYSKMYNQMWYSSLDHSVAVSLIVWHFTRDKKQTLAGLFHDIATPVFKHCIDFMNEDYETQESTEELTTKIIKESKEIMKLLGRDKIQIDEVNNYHIYPIADNDTPQLSADRLEYTLSNGLGATEKIWGLKEIEEIYKNIEIQKNEAGIEELGFKDKEIAEKFVHTMSMLSSMYIRNKTKFSMQFLADIMKKMSEKDLITINDLYNLSEKEVIQKIENCEIGNIAKCFKIWKNATNVCESDTRVDDKYCVSIDKIKIRYINPLVRNKDEFMRINKISDIAKQDIEKALNYKTKKYAYLNFDFFPTTESYVENK